jgi:hypothetical protein
VCTATAGAAASAAEQLDSCPMPTLLLGLLSTPTPLLLLPPLLVTFATCCCCRCSCSASSGPAKSSRLCLDHCCCWCQLPPSRLLLLLLVLLLLLPRTFSGSKNIFLRGPDLIAHSGSIRQVSSSNVLFSPSAHVAPGVRCRERGEQQSN